MWAVDFALSTCNGTRTIRYYFNDGQFYGLLADSRTDSNYVRLHTIYRQDVIIRGKYLEELHAYNGCKGAPPEPDDFARWRRDEGNAFAIVYDSNNPLALDCYEEKCEHSLREIMSSLAEGKQPPRFLNVLPCDGRRRAVIDLEHLILLEIR